MPRSRPGSEHEQDPGVTRGAHLVALSRVEHGREARPAAHGRAVGVDLHLAVDHDQVRALVDLVVLQALAGRQVDRDRPRLAARLRGRDRRRAGLFARRVTVANAQVPQ